MQRWSKLFIPTLREAPTDAEVASHKLLLRAGYIRQLGAGIYSYLPLGQRSINKIVAIVREEMDKIGQEFLLPTLNPVELWQESGREAVMGQNLFHLKDRKGAQLVLAMTHEEVITSIARNELRSYKQLPQIWYQIQTKFRDEPRPKSGLLRVRQFIMKDAYSFDIDAAGLDESYNKHDATYRTIFTRCGLDFVAVEADSGAMGGSGSQEFMVYTDAGEDFIASSASGYAANLEKATSQLAPVEDLAPTGDGTPELVSTPGKASIADVTEFFGIQSSQDIKCVAFMGARAGHPAGEPLRPIVAFLRGDHQVNETKLTALAGTADLRPMTPEELELHIGGPAGFLGPIGIPEVMTQGSLNGLKSGKALDKLKGVLRDVPSEGLKTIVVLDLGLEGRTNLVCGANKLDYHYRNVTPGRDFTQTLIADIRNINEGELDPIGGQPLRLGKAVEVGHIFKLGYKYTESMGARVLDANGKEVMPIMGCYGIGIERILTAAIESSAAKFKGQFPDTEKAGEQYALSPTIAPYEVIVTITNIKESDLLAAGEKIAADLTAAGIDVLLDDRDERAGVKFKDAELIGVPYRINIGKKLAEGQVELVDRLQQSTTDVTVETIVTHLQSLLKASKA
ncbi:proline--tRNA ligase [Granulicella sp. 5B5]|uniref:proline--tRNA ligase n=1 Tax=Granulicella sp. 5B5 TaxID=1617967 RepID=UPI0015F5C000|nr:proline--tRNA ligase [Granulicella sp. 5B5]QMV17829.1 proline--tRNA ligase [Granulicella sp. 5B5]